MVAEFKPICEIADEYERGLAALRKRREELQELLAHTAGYEQRRKILARITQLNAMIAGGQMDVYLMRKYGEG